MPFLKQKKFFWNIGKWVMTRYTVNFKPTKSRRKLKTERWALWSTRLTLTRPWIQSQMKCHICLNTSGRCWLKRFLELTLEMKSWSTIVLKGAFDLSDVQSTNWIMHNAYYIDAHLEAQQMKWYHVFNRCTSTKEWKQKWNWKCKWNENEDEDEDEVRGQRLFGQK